MLGSVLLSIMTPCNRGEPLKQVGHVAANHENDIFLIGYVIVVIDCIMCAHLDKILKKSFTRHPWPLQDTLSAGA